MAQAFNPSTWEAVLQEFKASLVYIAGSRTEKPCFGKKQKMGKVLRLYGVQ